LTVYQNLIAEAGIFTTLQAQNLSNIVSLNINQISASIFVSSSNIVASTSISSPVGRLTNITASNISASGYVSSSNLWAASSLNVPSIYSTNITASNISASGYVSSSNLWAASSLNVPSIYSTNITSSNISASGYVSSSNLWVATNLSVPSIYSTNVTSSNIIVNGPISASGVISSSGIYSNNNIYTNQFNATSITSSNITVSQSIVCDTISAYIPDEFMVAVSDELSDLTTGSNKVQFIFPFSLTGSKLTAYVHTAPVGSFITSSVRFIGGSTISASISSSVKSGSTNTTYYVDKYQEVAIDINQVGGLLTGKGLKLLFEGIRRL